MSVQIIELDGKPAFAVVPVAQWKALLERLEDLQDAVDARAAANEETLPLDFIERRLAGESPFKLWREQRGLTLEALADRAGCTPQMLSMIERGETKPSADLLARLASALGCDMDSLQCD